MKIDERHFATIRNQNLNLHATECDFSRWQPQKITTPAACIASNLKTIKNRLKTPITRNDLVWLYRQPDVEPETKFIAAMLWGYGAPKDSKPDNRGPWRLLQMFEKPDHTREVLKNISIATPKDIATAYNYMSKNIKQCGQSFITKHLYFLGKAQEINEYPLIFDARVARGLLKLALPEQEHSLLSMVRVGTKLGVDTYMTYLNFAWQEATRIDCEPDKIEHFLFSIAK